jgi:type III secretion protein D
MQTVDVDFDTLDPRAGDSVPAPLAVAGQSQLKRELRVLAGPQAGAKLLLDVGAETQIGSLRARGCQIVLRDPQVVDQRIRLRVREHNVRIKVVSGVVDIAGQILTGPCATDWPLYTPLRVGDTVIAFGEADSARWEQVTAFPVAKVPGEDSANDAAHTAQEENAATGTNDVVVKPRRRVEAWLAMCGGVVTIVSFGLLAFVSVVTPAQGDSGNDHQRLLRLLQTNEFRALTASPNAEGRLLVRGDVLSSADRMSLDRALAQADLRPVLDVRVAEQMAAAVRDVYRMNGVVAEATPPNSLNDVGMVRVRTREGDLEKLQKVTATARRDVPGLSVLTVDNVQPPVIPTVTPVPNDPGKRVASVVPGESPYVVTADGTRYFIGALLPSGHRLASISDQQVLLSKDGVVSPLVF